MTTTDLRLEKIRIYSSELDILRLDKCFGNLSGNKFLKLRNLTHPIQEGKIKKIVSFGGAYSNHLHALAHFAKQHNIPSLGIVRGEAVSNHTLDDCQKQGMEIAFMARTEFDGILMRRDYTSWLAPYTHIVPMGGDDADGINGVCEYFAKDELRKYKTIVVSVGTATTLLGIARALPNSQCIGIASHGDLTLQAKIKSSSLKNAAIHHYHTLGHFGKITPHLLRYMNDFYQRFQIALDVVYTSKTMHYIERHITHLEMPLLFVHTGGLQGNRSVQQRLIF